MDENNNPLSYDAPKEGDYGVDKPQETASTDSSNVSTSTTANTDTSTSAFSLNTESFSTGSSSSQSAPSTSNQEVFGGSVEGNTSVNNNYNNSYASPYSNGQEEISKGFAIASLVMGILSIITCCCSITGILFGILGIIFYCVQQKDSEGKRPTQATIGLVLSIIGLVIAVGSIIFGLLASGTDWYQEILRNAQSV